MNIIPRIISCGEFDAAEINNGKETTVPRKVSLFEIELITQCGGVSHIDGVAYPVKKNNIVCAKPGQIRFTQLPFQCRFLHVIVEDEGLCQLLNAVPDVITPTNNEFQTLFETLITAYHTPTIYSEVELLGALFTLFSRLAGYCTIQQKRDREKSQEMMMRKAIDFIDMNFREHVTLDDVASHIHMSKIYFHNQFRAATGLRPHEYLLKKRLNLAMELLQTTDLTFTDIAFHCGFSSQSYMNAVFKRELNMTPSTYLKMVKTKA